MTAEKKDRKPRVKKVVSVIKAVTTEGMENMEIVEEGVQVAEPLDMSNPSDELKEKFMPGYWKAKRKDGNSELLLMDDMELSHKLKALSFAKKQASKYAKLQEIHMNKYEELLISLESIDGLDEEQAIEAMSVVITK